MSNHKQTGYTSLTQWSLFEMVVLKYHYEALAIVNEDPTNNEIPSNEQLKQFEEKLDLPDDMYKILFRELYKIARNSQTSYEAGGTFKERISKHPRTNSPSKRYYMSIAVAASMIEDIWQLNRENWNEEDPFTSFNCNLCLSCCQCHECSPQCTFCSNCKTKQ